LLLAVAGLPTGVAQSGGHPTAAKPAPQGKPMSQAASAWPVDAEVAEKLEQYDASGAPLALQEAADAAAAHDGATPPDPEAGLGLARQRVGGWLAILSRIDRDLEPGFDPSRAPPRRVEPPMGADGLQLPPGVKPEDVRDPAARAAYVQAMADNERRRAAFARQLQLHQAARAIAERAPPSVADAHTTLALPKQEIGGLIAAAPIRPQDRTALEAALAAAPDR
jgi:hypothetical protein